MFEILRKLLEDSADAAIISVLIVTGTTAALPAWRSNKGFIIAGWVMGVVVGIALARSPLPDWFAILGTAAGVITGPMTINKLQGRTLGDLIEEIYKRKNSTPKK